MSRPPLFVRVAGSPRPAFLLCLCYAAIIVGWCEGSVVWWLGLAAVGLFIRTLSAVGQLRRYKAWLAEWNAMGAKEEPAPARKEKAGGRRRVFVSSAVVLVLAIPACSQYLCGSEEWVTALRLLWASACIYLIGLVIRSITRRITRGRKAQPKAATAPEAATAPVEWMLGRASSSPSRAEAARQLPEYCTRLLSSGSARSEK